MAAATDGFTPDDRQFVEQELARAAASWNDALFLQESRRLAAGFVADHREAASFVAEKASLSLKSRLPFAMIRLGDGEGNVLPLARDAWAPGGAGELKWFNAIFEGQDGQRLRLDAARPFASSMVEALCGADVLGIRTLKLADKPPDIAVARQAFDRGKLRGTLGLIRGRQVIEALLREGRLRQATLTTAWVHLTLVPHLARLIDEARSLVVVSGRQELAPEFCRRFSPKPVQFVAVPLEGRWRSSGMQAHYPAVFQDVLSRLERCQGGELVLVGAGLFGKMYCSAAKRAGAVALDLGSAFDLLAGHKTRPVHKNTDLDAVRWLPRS